MKPEQPALRSNAPAAEAPNASCTRLAVEGNAYSGVAVATMTRSICEGNTCATSSASRAARMARVAVLSRSPATTCRSLMPVRDTIHSSVVSTTRARSALVSTFSGTDMPQPVI